MTEPLQIARAGLDDVLPVIVVFVVIVAQIIKAAKRVAQMGGQRPAREPGRAPPRPAAGARPGFPPPPPRAAPEPSPQDELRRFLETLTGIPAEEPETPAPDAGPTTVNVPPEQPTHVLRGPDTRSEAYMRTAVSHPPSPPPPPRVAHPVRMSAAAATRAAGRKTLSSGQRGKVVRRRVALRPDAKGAAAREIGTISAIAALRRLGRPGAVAEAVVLAEILGPPRALRGQSTPYVPSQD